MKRAALLLFAALPLLAAERPVPGPMKPFVSPSRDERALPSGFRYSLVPFGSLRMARVELSVRNNDSDTDMAELVANYLLEGTRRRNAAALSTAASDLGVVGGAIRVSVTPGETIISAEALSESAAALVRLIAEIVNDSAFPPEALESVKADQLRRMENRRTQTASKALARADALIFGIEPSGDAVRAATADSVRQYWTARYTPAAAHLYVAGVFDKDAVDAAVRESFASESGRPVIHLIDRPGATQSRITVAWPTPDPAHADYFVLNVLNMVMGSMQRSRIIANVREQHGYSYNIFSRLYGRPQSSRWAVSGDVATGVTAAALREILAEVARLGSEPPPADELRRFQTFMSGVILSERATPEGIVSALRWQEMHGLPVDDLATFVPRVFAVSAEDVRRVAQRYLTPSRAAIVVVGDRKAIESQLTELGGVVNE